MENEEQILALDNYQGQDLIPNVDVPVEKNEIKEVDSEVVQHIYPAPFNHSYGNSSVDLSIAENERIMTEEYHNWWRYGAKKGFLGVNYTPEEHQPERNRLRDEWYQKYYGMSHEEYEKGKPNVTMYGYTADLKGTAEHLDNMFQGVMAPGLGVMDFGMDLVGLFAG